MLDCFRKFLGGVGRDEDSGTAGRDAHRRASDQIPSRPMRQDTQPHPRAGSSGFPGRDIINAAVRNRCSENAGDSNADFTWFQAHAGLHEGDREEYGSHEGRQKYCTGHAGFGHRRGGPDRSERTNEQENYLVSSWHTCSERLLYIGRVTIHIVHYLIIVITPPQGHFRMRRETTTKHRASTPYGIVHRSALWDNCGVVPNVAVLTLPAQDRQELICWPVACIERLLPVFEADEPDDSRLTDALDGARKFALGQLSVGPMRKLAFGCHAAAREASSAPASSVARACGQAVAVAHMAGHSREMARYTSKALTGDMLSQELEWQRTHVPDRFREYVYGDDA